VPEFRHLEVAQKSGNPVWKLYYNGAVGGHAILGIPMVRRLKAAFGETLRVWPFETGWKALAESDLNEVDVVAVEVAAAPVKAAPLPGEVKDVTEIRALVEHLAKLDETGKLGALFAPAKGTPDAILATVSTEEGWALGA